LALLAATGVGAKAAAIYSVQNVQFPTDPAFTQLLGINNGSTIGFHGAGDCPGFHINLTKQLRWTNLSTLRSDAQQIRVQRGQLTSPLTLN